MRVEVWKDIAGYEGRYEISSKGNVRNSKKELLKLHISNKGYKVVHLSKGSTNKKTLLVHRLVAIHFIPNSNNLPEVNHKDEDKHNNDECNLEWCTTQYNIEYSKGKIVQQIMNNEIINEYSSAIAAAIALGKKHSRNIRGCCNNEYKTAYGFEWRYKECI
jgi:hypothetical protein